MDLSPHNSYDIAILPPVLIQTLDSLWFLGIGRDTGVMTA